MLTAMRQIGTILAMIAGDKPDGGGGDGGGGKKWCNEIERM